MNAKINDFLNQIAKEKDIRILLACETGSRAWGFPSPNSDFDVRMIYVHRKDWYLSLVEGSDTIEMMSENRDLDITGWDLRKSLRLLWKSNPPLLERIQSPIIYRCDDAFLSGFRALAEKNYSRIASIHHYLSMAKKYFSETLESKEYKLKKLFYALRTATTCKWILDREEIPPVEFEKIINGLVMETALTNRIHELIALKSTKDEAYLHQGEEMVLKFIEECIMVADKEASKLPPARANMEDLNVFFRETLNAQWTSMN